MGLRKISNITIGVRHRRDLGDIDSLARSIAEIGLLHPIVIKPDGRLIAGERRLAACARLGWTDIPVTVVDLAAVVVGEFAENTHRKNFTLSEAVAIKRALEPIERAAAKERQAAGGRLKACANLAEASKGTVRDKVAAFAGTKRTTLEKAEAIVDAAEAEPERFGNLLADMDRTGRVNGLYKRLKIIKQVATDVGLDDNRSALIAAAKATEPDKQIEALKKRATKPKASPAENPIAAAWRRASQGQRYEFACSHHTEIMRAQQSRGLAGPSCERAEHERIRQIADRAEARSNAAMVSAAPDDDLDLDIPPELRRSELTS